MQQTRLLAELAVLSPPYKRVLSKIRSIGTNLTNPKNLASTNSRNKALRADLQRIRDELQGCVKTSQALPGPEALSRFEAAAQSLLGSRARVAGPSVVSPVLAPIQQGDQQSASGEGHFLGNDH